MKTALASLAALAVLLALALPAAAQPAERLILVSPETTYEFRITGEGKPASASIFLHDGASHDGVLRSAACGQVGLSTNVIGLSTSGQRLATLECGVLAKGSTHVVRLDSNASAFVGRIPAVNATLAP